MVSISMVNFSDALAAGPAPFEAGSFSSSSSSSASLMTLGAGFTVEQ